MPYKIDGTNNMKSHVTLPLRCLFIFFILAMSITQGVLGDGKTRNSRPLQLQIGFGYSGYGMSVGYNINAVFYCAIEHFDVNSKNEGNGGEIKGETEFTLWQNKLRISPWSKSSFYFHAGYALVDWKERIYGSGTLSDSDFSSSDFKAIIDWPESAYTYGFGWDWVADAGFSGGFSIFKFVIDKPDVKITDYTSMSSNEEREDAEEILQNSQHEKSEKILGVLYLGFNF